MTPEEARTVLGHIDQALQKLDYGRRLQQQHRRLIRQHQHKVAKASKEFLSYLLRELKPRLRRLRGKTPGDVVKNLADWEAIKEEGRKIFNAPLAEIAASSATQIRKHSIFQKQRTDPLGQAATTWANKHAAKLVTSITTETQKALRQAVREGLDQGLSIGEISASLRPLIGLNDRQVLSASRLATRLEEAGLPQAAIEKRLGRYITKAHNYRSTMIARTETASALCEGQRIGYQGMGVRKLKRVEDPDACDICAEHDGEEYDIDETEGVLPEHPNCEGTWVPVIATAEEELEYREARSIRQAENFAKKHLVTKHVSYEGLSIKTANYLNKTLTRLVKKYGYKLSAFGTDIGLAKTPVRNWLGPMLRKPSVWAFQQMTFEQENVIVLNSQVWTKSLATLEKEAARMHERGWWVAKTPAGVITHEYGHAIDDAFGHLTYTPHFLNLYDELRRSGEAKKALGGYAMDHFMRHSGNWRYVEAFAEAFAGYTQGAFRTSYPKIHKIMKDLLKGTGGG